MYNVNRYNVNMLICHFTDIYNNLCKYDQIFDTKCITVLSWFKNVIMT